MKAAFVRLVFLVLVQLILIRCESSRQEELVHIPDPSFLKALIELGVDEDGDGQISYPEAESTLSIRLDPSNISDLSGLDAFIRLDSLIALKIKSPPLIFRKTGNLRYSIAEET